MAYFNHAFQKVFLGTGTVANPDGFTALNGGQLGTTGNIFAAGEFGFVDPKTWTIQSTTYSPSQGCCPLILASGSVLANDKIGPFHGGYLESNKSKIINPKYVNSFYRVDPCAPTQAVLNIGVTPHTGGGIALAIDGLVGGTGYTNGTYNVSVTGGTGFGAIIQVTVAGGIVTAAVLLDGGYGYTDNDTLTLVGGNNDAEVDVNGVSDPVAGCCPEFLCDETYSLRIDVKGSPALRFLNHNAYLTVSAYTGCCPAGAIAPTPVDPTLVMIEWAKQIVNSPLISPFVLPVVSASNGNIYYAPGTVDVFGTPVSNTWDTYVSTGYTQGDCAGLILYGAYVDTKFGNCTFQISDFYEKEPVRLYASEVDYNGDPCAFSGICVVNECLGTQAMGLGESVVRDLILSESYRQNFFHSDFRIREITQGYDILNQINRNALYTRYYLLHSVPRHNNPTGTFDNDQYLLEIITDTAIPTFETFVNDWIDNCSQCNGFEVFGCETFCVPDVPVVPPTVGP
jgi:hypothetical protein